MFGKILQAVVSFAVLAITLPLVGPIAAAAISNAAGQAFGLATGIQQGGFSWKSVAISAVAAGVTLGVDATGVFNGIASTALRTGASAATSSALTQGVALATGLQSKFDFAGVAAAGIGAGVGSAVGGSFKPTGNPWGQGGQQLVTSGASLLANAATRSMIDGTDFGDNIISALPDVIAQTIANTIGNLVADAVAGDGKPKTASRPDDTATPQTASAATPASSVTLTAAEKQKLLQAALPDAIAGIKTASTSTALDAAELADMQAAATTLGRKDTNYAYGAIPDQPTAGAAAGMEN